MAGPGSARILRPGRNCWRVERAERAGFIIDGAAYFTAIAEAFEQARHSIVLVGWDVDGRICLRPGDPPVHMGPLLAACVEARPDLHAWVLGWDFSPIYWLERDPLLRLRFAFGSSDRVHFAYDDRAPPGGSQHEKLVVIDDALAFCGGLDLCDVRWDTPEHKADDARRVDVHDKGYRPHHDVQIAVDGEAAAALGELVRERWRLATGETIPPVHDRTARPWPQSICVDLRDVDVGISRTRPGQGDAPGIREVEQLWIDSIRAARESIVIENAYFTSRTVADELDRRLAQSDVEAVLVTPQEGSGWMEEVTMGVLRDECLSNVIHRHDAKRFAVVTPWLPPANAGEPPVSLNLHSKVCIVDDGFVRIGSANLTNRSMGLDSECDLAIEANGREDVALAIAGLRNRLLAEHLDTTPERVADKIAARGRIAAAIESLSHGERCLKPYEPSPSPLADELLPDAELVDPPRPISGRMVGRWLTRSGPDGGKGRRWRWAGVAWWTTLVALLVVARLAGWIDAERLLHLVEATRDAPVLALLGIVGAFVVGGLMFVPVTLMIALCGALFGPWLGLAYALCGAFGGALVFHVLGRTVGHPLIDALAGPRLRRRLRDVARRGLVAVAVLRMLPIAPHVVVGLAAGAARVSLRDYMLASMLVMTPGAFALVLVGDQVTGGRATAWTAVAIVAGLAAVITTGIVLAKRWMSRNPDVDFAPG